MTLGFFKDIFHDLRGGNFLGVDIGTTSVKIAELSRSPLGLRLNNYGLLESYGSLDRLNDAIQTSSLKMLKNETAELIKILLNRMGTRTRDAVVSIPPFSAFTVLLEIPQMSSDDVTRAMQFQARQYIPIPIQDTTLEWLKVGEYTDEKGVTKQQILLVSVPNETVQHYQEIFRFAGLNLVAIELENIAIVRALISGDPTPTAILDFGSRSSSVSIVDGGFLKAVSQTDYGGGNLTQAIASGLNITALRAEGLKKQKGLLGSGGEFELSTLMLPFIDVILSEVKRASQTYFEKYARSVERVIVTGGGINLPGILEYMEKQLALTVIRANPFDKKVIYPKELNAFIEDLGPIFTVPIGLALKELA